MAFSNRIPEELGPNEYFKSLESVPSSDLIDLTVSNPSRCGFRYPEALSKVLARPENLDYEPDPRGTETARKALAEYLSTADDPVDAGDLFLTASTSEAYSLLFRLLADPGQDVHIPLPGYPLLEHLARLDGIRVLPYRLRREPGWPLDRESLERRISEQSRVLVTISPHNPTGTWFDGKTMEGLIERCARSGMALVSDEVFRDYAEGVLPGFPKDPGILTFRLGGLSKTLGLPGWKLSWIRMGGPTDLLREARERLEFAADAYLSVNTPVQAALRDILALAPGMTEMIRNRVRGNRKLLEGYGWKGVGLKVWPAQGGWYGLLELPDQGVDDESVASGLILKASLAVHPGSFYEMEGDFLVVSLLGEPEEFQEGLKRLDQALPAILKAG